MQGAAGNGYHEGFLPNLAKVQDLKWFIQLETSVLVIDLNMPIVENVRLGEVFEYESKIMWYVTSAVVTSLSSFCAFTRSSTLALCNELIALAGLAVALPLIHRFWPRCSSSWTGPHLALSLLPLVLKNGQVSTPYKLLLH